MIKSQNAQSTKNAVNKKPLKVKKGGRSDLSDCSDPSTTLQHNMITKHLPGRKVERNAPKYKLLAKPMNCTKLDDEMIQPQCQRINSAAPIKFHKDSRKLTRESNKLKTRCNSSNALNKTDEELEECNSSLADNRHNYHSAQQSNEKNPPEVNRRTDCMSVTNAVRLTISEKRSNFINGSGRANTQGIHLLPSTNKNYRNTKRIDFSRRMHMMDRPIVIIIFDGVIGNFHKESIW